MFLFPTLTIRMVLPCAIAILFGASPQRLLAQAPTISSFSPSSGPVGSLITITGTNLTSPSVTVGGVTAIVVNNNGSQLAIMAMPGTVNGPVAVTTANGTATSTSNFTVIPTPYPTLAQGGKLVGGGAIGNAEQGYAVAISADGTTALIGGPSDDAQKGAAWVYTRGNGGVWTQQGNKLTATGAVGTARLGVSVALSADGNTAIVGGSTDNGSIGAAWIFTRTGGIWAQQGNKLVGIDAVGNPSQGSAVALSADGNTAIIGGPNDVGAGAAWVFVRNGNVWSQQGSKLVGTGAVGNALQGVAVAISADASTAMVGGQYDNNGLGAAWIYTRTGTTWTQQGNKLVGTTTSVSPSQQGASVALSADGNTAIMGGYLDAAQLGAAWVFVRNSATWSQQGNKLVGTGASGTMVYQGTDVALTADGNTALVGAMADANNLGATWVYTRSSGTWTQRGSKLIGAGAFRDTRQGWAVAISSDGNTSLVGGYEDFNGGGTGATWVFVACNASTATQAFNLDAFSGTIVAGNNTFTTATGCRLIAEINSSNTGTDISGNVTGKVWLEYFVPTYNGKPYVARHYEITPANNAATATATITLNFLQSEFDAYNALGNVGPLLPTGPNDIANKANIRITKYNGTSNDNTGTPGSYSGNATIIDPADDNIKWNAYNNRWEITFDVTGFSGFFLTNSQSIILPLTNISLQASIQNNNALIEWRIAQPVQQRYELQKSTDGATFSTIDLQNGDGISGKFLYHDIGLPNGTYYYRIKATDKNGNITFSNTALLRKGSASFVLDVFPNPAINGSLLQVSTTQASMQYLRLMDAAGKVLLSKKVGSITGSTSFLLPNHLPAGTYYLQVETDKEIAHKQLVIQ